MRKDFLMTKLHFRYGAMGSSKTALALMLAYNFSEKGMKPLLCKPATDTRTEKMWSRTGLESDCISLEELCSKDLNEIAGYDCVIVDEVQFATTEQVDFLAGIVDHVHIPVFAYGLKTDFQGKLFVGAKRMLELSDTIEEMKSACWCGSAAKFSARVDADGNVLREGDTVDIGGHEDKPHYVALCRKHFLSGRSGL
jgi:thymidine kinase